VTDIADAPETVAPTGPLKTLDLPDEHVLAVNSEKRILGLRVIRYNEVVDHPHYGRMLFLPGAFILPSGPQGVRLRMDHADPPTGLGVAFRDETDAPYMDFRVSKTQRGDEQLTLARDGVSRGTSPGFYEIPGKPQQKLVDGRQTTVYGPGSAVLAELSTTWTPTFPGDGVVYVLSKHEGEGQMAEDNAPAIQPGIDYEALAAVNAAAIERVLVANRDASAETKIETLLTKFDQMVELQRSRMRSRSRCSRTGSASPCDSSPASGSRNPRSRRWPSTTSSRVSSRVSSRQCSRPTTTTSSGRTGPSSSPVARSVPRLPAGR
jgi:hypothetical protein